MKMMENKTIGLVFIEGYADWEFGFLSGGAVEIFAARVVALSPEAFPVTSIGGLKLTPERGVSAQENADLDAVALIGATGWFSDTPPDIAPLILSVHARGGVVGGICGGTLALARAGLLNDRAHTSNQPGLLEEKVQDYSGARHYRDVPHAVSDGRVISAPETSPGTFAEAFLEALYPDAADRLSNMHIFVSSDSPRI
jgi:putative intracellular protease/amidase